LAGLALAPLLDGRLRFIPERYARTYQTWLENLRDWPISRQLWWGHRIPVWSRPGQHENRCEYGTWSTVGQSDQGPVTYACVRPGFEELEGAMESEGWVRDGDVLDTWFSSALWPFSTLGWPDPSPDLKAFYPGDVLCTAREIITLWVSRMVMMGQYCAGDIPFKDVYIHAMIQDGLGRKMSKSLGNGIDPLVAIDSHGADAMRFTLASMTTDTQDIRMPVESMRLPDGRQVNTSPKFDVGRNFCNKLWNASRFAMMNLEGMDPAAFDPARMDTTDRWIVSRLAGTIREVTQGIEQFRFSEPLNLLYRFFWNDLCDWYLEWAKPKMADPARRPVSQNVLAFVLDQTFRLLHPFLPFITEGIFQNLNELCPVRGLKGIAEAAPAKALTLAPWPPCLDAMIDPAIEARIELVQGVIRAIREIRNARAIPPGRPLKVSAKTTTENVEVLTRNAGLILQLAVLDGFQVATAIDKPANAAVGMAGAVEVFVHDAVDVAAERQRLEKQRQQLLAGLKGVEAKLGNESFRAKAKPEVVAQTEAKQAEFQAQLAAVENHLAGLAGT